MDSWCSPGTTLPGGRRGSRAIDRHHRRLAVWAHALGLRIPPRRDAIYSALKN